MQKEASKYVKLWKFYLLIAMAGSLGAVCRYAEGLLLQDIQPAGFPAATFACNIAGSLLLGYVLAKRSMTEGQQLFKEVVGTGFLGAFTTFSAFSVETVDLLNSGRTGIALLYIISSLWLGYAAAFAGSKAGGAARSRKKEQL
ncbi:fluoride efflux transporter CrcB [Paenibacillus gansuensis]|uniref:Fluoride-specific ion channel FluC n=1 Tax=Paenibacillus gansuensis TaxID=306542 RepID=A0ABW5PC13_9BACL